MVIGIFSTPNFEFMVIGNDKVHAEKLLDASLQSHARSLGSDGTYFSRFADDATYLTANVGDCFRDNEPLKL